MASENRQNTADYSEDVGRTLPGAYDMSPSLTDDYVHIQVGGGRRAPSSTIVTPTRTLRPRIKHQQTQDFAIVTIVVIDPIEKS